MDELTDAPALAENMDADRPVPLSLDTLARLPAAVARPGYDRASLSAGIVHFGVGNFHRSHQAVYLDRLMNRGLALDWAVIGVATRPADRAVHDDLAAQDWLWSVVEQSATRSRARVVGPMVDMIAPGEGTRVLHALADPAIRIVTLTVTEGGYYTDADGAFDASHPEIAADTGDEPTTVFGQIAEGLRRRREAGVAPFTVVSCDNLSGNGAICRAAVIGTARLRNGELADWIESDVSFPDGMVDRITPATGPHEIAAIRERHGVADRRPVFCEDFIQWVLEDDFPAGRPPLEEAGVEFVADVAGHEAMKLRILNAGHAIIAYPAGLLGIAHAHEAMADPLIAAFLDRVTREEIVPHVPAVPGSDPVSYCERVRERFGNPKIADTIRRLCLDGSNRQPKFIVPTLRDRLAADRPIDGLALECALWCRYCFGTTESGETIEPNDPAWPRLQAHARRARHDPAAWLELTDIYGATASDERFRAAFSQALDAVWRHGTTAAIERYLAGAA